MVETQYGTIVLAEPNHPLIEDFDFDRYWEEKVCSIPGGIQISLPDKSGDVPTEIRVLAEPTPIEDDWEHVAEIGLHAPGGRLQIYSWMADEDLAGEIDVPREPLIARIHWAGLEAWLDHVNANQHEEALTDVRTRVDLVPGELGEVRTLRTWHDWAPPEHESVGPSGLRTFRGRAVAPRRATLEPIGRTFWSPYPEVEEGSVHGLWRDPKDGSRWANGSGRSVPFLQELSPEEADRLEAESFPNVYTYARDQQGRIWTSNQMPLERTPAVLFVPAQRWVVLRDALADSVQVVDLPAGWSRITRRPFDGSSPAVLVDDIEGDGTDGLYQRWPDGAEIAW